ncbi:MAG: hypothetical protein ACTSP1_15590 [Candidatus Freyarchaeota archaeon]
MNKNKIKQEITSIKQDYLELVSDKSIGGSHPLNELSQKILEFISKSPEKYIVPLFILSEIFRDIAEDQCEREVTTRECEELYEKLHELILKTITDMERDAGDYILLADCTNLIKAYINVVP